MSNELCTQVYSGITDDFRNDYQLTIYALRRSGHHAVMVWLAYHFGVPVYVLNDVKPYSDPCATSCFTNNWDIGSEWLTSPRSDIEEFRSKRKHCLMISVQDLDLRGIDNRKDIFLWTEKFLGGSRKKFSVLVLRDPFNLLASRLAKPEPLLELIDAKALLDVWEGYAREFVEETTYLGTCLRVNFNLWFSSLAYRRTLSEQIGRSFTDEGIEIVPRAGGGSSFEGTSFNQRGSQMRVLDRWKHFSRDCNFRAAFERRHTLAYLYRRIFPHDRTVEQFLSSLEI